MAPRRLVAGCPTAGRRRSQHQRNHRHRGMLVQTLMPSLMAVMLFLVGPAAGKVSGRAGKSAATVCTRRRPHAPHMFRRPIACKHRGLSHVQ